MALGSIQPLTNEYQGYLGGRWPVRWADNLTTFMCRLSRNPGRDICFKAYYTYQYLTGNDSALICESGSSASLCWSIGLNQGDEIDSNIIVFCYNVNSIISNNKLMVHMYIVKNTTIFLIVRLLLIRYNYMFRPPMLAIFRLYMKHLTISYIYTWVGGFTVCGMGWVRDLVLCL